MDCKDVASADMLRKTFLRRWSEAAKTDEHFAHVFKQLKNDKWFGRLFPFTAFENASRTTNSTERANRWFRKRQKSHYRIRTERTITSMIHADLVYRRNREPSDTPPTILKPRSATLQRRA
jgi:hypothetical protein